MQPFDEPNLNFLPFLIDDLIYVDKNSISLASASLPSVVVTIESKEIVTEKSTDSQVVILYILLESDVLQPEEHDLLQNIIKNGLKLEKSQTKQMALAKYKAEVISYPHYFLIFSQVRPYLIQGEKYQIISQTPNQRKLLWADNLTTLAKEKNLKARLWGQLQVMFGLK